MVGADAYLVFGANHAVRVHTTQARFLDGKRLVAIVERGSDSGHNHFLAFGHVGRATNYLFRFFSVAQIHLGYVQVVAIGVWLAGEYLAHNQALKAAANCFHFFHCAHFQSQRCECIAHLLRRECNVDVLFKPFI